MAKLYLLNGNKYLLTICEHVNETNNMANMRAAIFEVNENKLVKTVHYETKAQNAFSPEIALGNMNIKAALSVAPMGGCEYIIQTLKNKLYDEIHKQRSGSAELKTESENDLETGTHFYIEKSDDGKTYDVYQPDENGKYTQKLHSYMTADGVLNMLAKQSLAFDGVTFAFKM